MKIFPESFGLYKPKSVVSGDVYWYHKKNNLALIAAVDCTGHGVPGALMSMIAVEKLNEAIAQNIFRPSEILSHLNKGVKSTLKQKEDSVSKDGMDIALCCFDLEKNILNFSGAMRPLWIIRNKELLEYKPTKTSIGGITSDEQNFIEHEIKIQKGDSIYIFSDGYADQFGGDKGKKMMTKNMKDLLLSIQNISMIEQEKILNDKLTGWQGEFEQVDDILVIGIKI
jgi:serine phosphatase RsbU (regulator of sigma subunit)